MLDIQIRRACLLIIDTSEFSSRTLQCHLTPRTLLLKTAHKPTQTQRQKQTHTHREPKTHIYRNRQHRQTDRPGTDKNTQSESPIQIPTDSQIHIRERYWQMDIKIQIFWINFQGKSFRDLLRGNSATRKNWWKIPWGYYSCFCPWVTVISPTR